MKSKEWTLSLDPDEEEYLASDQKVADEYAAWIFGNETEPAVGGVGQI